jgi:hypothetical protein
VYGNVKGPVQLVGEPKARTGEIIEGKPLCGHVAIHEPLQTFPHGGGAQVTNGAFLPGGLADQGFTAWQGAVKSESPSAPLQAMGGRAKGREEARACAHAKGLAPKLGLGGLK